ncbi:MAG: hypothetical protein ACT443_09120 [Gemmatimonadota bacterium]
MSDKSGTRSLSSGAFIAPIALITRISSSLTGCSRLLSSYDTGPDGLPRSERQFRRYLATGHADSALLQLADPKRKDQLPGDPLLRLLFDGMAAHYAGDYERSVAAFDQAALISEDRVTKSVSRATLSVVVNDLSRAYEPGPTERLLIPYYAALGYAKAGNYAEAAVEARRLSALLQLLQDKGEAPEPEAHAFFRYFAGAIFEAAGEHEDAAVAYRNAALLDSTSLSSLPALSSLSSQVVILLEQGFAPHRVQESLFLPLADYEVHQFDGDRSDDERSSASSQIAERVLAFASTAGPRTGPPQSRNLWVPPPRERERERQRDRKHEDHSYLLRLSWPVMYEPAPAAPPDIRIDSVSATAFESVSLADAVLGDFRREQPAIIARTVARGVAKYALTKSAEKKADEKSDALGDVVGALANIAGAVTEQADTRSWHLLPASISMVRLTLTPGTHRLRVNGIDLGTIEVAAGRVSVVSRRIWN